MTLLGLRSLELALQVGYAPRRGGGFSQHAFIDWRLSMTFDDAKARGILGEVETIWLDRGNDAEATRGRLADRPLTDSVITRKYKKGAGAPKTNQPTGLRWPVERPNFWPSNLGQRRRDTDRKTVHRPSQPSRAVVFLLTAKLIDW